MTTLSSLVERKLLSADWADALTPMEDRLTAIGEFLRTENAAGHSYLPAANHILRAFASPLAKVKVLIVGQDPYPTPGHPMGLSFSVAREVWPLPASLVNIYKELRADLDLVPPKHGDLSGWSDQGVMLLNRVLTVRPGSAGSHRGRGWEEITECAINAFANRGGPSAAILWGRDAQNLKPLLGEIPWVESAHPSPLSAHRGFFGSKPFSRVNKMLVKQGGDPIDWGNLGPAPADRGN
jgi:uracil-DNA glycosylase